MVGLALTFWSDIAGHEINHRILIGLGLSLLGTLSASFGNMASIGLGKRGVGVRLGPLADDQNVDAELRQLDGGSEAGASGPDHQDRRRNLLFSFVHNCAPSLDRITD